MFINYSGEAAAKLWRKSKYALAKEKVWWLIEQEKLTNGGIIWIYNGNVLMLFPIWTCKANSVIYTHPLLRLIWGEHIHYTTITVKKKNRMEGHDYFVSAIPEDYLDKGFIHSMEAKATCLMRRRSFSCFVELYSLASKSSSEYVLRRFWIWVLFAFLGSWSSPLSRITTCIQWKY